MQRLEYANSLARKLGEDVIEHRGRQHIRADVLDARTPPIDESAKAGISTQWLDDVEPQVARSPRGPQQLSVDSPCRRRDRETLAGHEPPDRPFGYAEETRKFAEAGFQILYDHADAVQFVDRQQNRLFVHRLLKTLKLSPVPPPTCPPYSGN